jgi:hypothetical protein
MDNGTLGQPSYFCWNVGGSTYKHADIGNIRTFGHMPGDPRTVTRGRKKCIRSSLHVGTGRIRWRPIPCCRLRRSGSLLFLVGRR